MANEKKIIYGGHFGNTLITKERFLSSWKGHLAQITNIADSMEEFDKISALTDELKKIVAEKADEHITESEASERNIPAVRSLQLSN